MSFVWFSFFLSQCNFYRLKYSRKLKWHFTSRWLFRFIGIVIYFLVCIKIRHKHITSITVNEELCHIYELIAIYPCVWIAKHLFLKVKLFQFERWKILSFICLVSIDHFSVFHQAIFSRIIFFFKIFYVHECWMKEKWFMFMELGNIEKKTQCVVEKENTNRHTHKHTHRNTNTHTHTQLSLFRWRNLFENTQEKIFHSNCDEWIRDQRKKKLGLTLLLSE